MSNARFYRRLFFLSLFLLLFSVCCLAQVPEASSTPPGSNPDEEVVRIGTSIIQTGVSVFDKKGNFVKDLKPEDFELRVNGKPVAISFFEVVNGQLSPVISKSGVTNPTTSESVTVPETSTPRGRTIIFVIDDVHLSAETMVRARRMVLNFIEKDKQPEDTVAIISSSGKIGFLQQFTNDDVVLRAAAGRLIYNRDYKPIDPSNPPMTEFEALLIDRFDPEVTNKFAAVIAAENSGSDINTAKEIARQRAKSVLNQAAVTNRKIYDSLEQSVRAVGELPGRKTVFLVSDGFLLDSQNSDSSYRLQRIIDAAARNNSVIYALDAKGLEAGFPEGFAGSFRTQGDERFELGNGMFSLADGTGGKFIQNTNDLQAGVTSVLEEASHYYLLAWQPESEDGKSEKFSKIQVKVKNRPELKVRAQGGYLTASTKKTAEETKKVENKSTAAKTVLPESEQKLNTALTAQLPTRDLPTSMVLNYFDAPNDGGTLAGSLKIDGSQVDFTTDANKASANVDLVGAIYDADGKRQDYFRKLLTIDSNPSAIDKKSSTNFYYNFQNKLKSGLYQVRVAVRDTKSGRLGSVIQWIEIPDLTSHKLAASSLIISERSDKPQKGSVADSLKVDEETSVNVDRRFNRASYLRYIIFIYNARSQKDSGKPAITVKTKLLRGKDIIINSPETKVSADSQDAGRLFYGAELPLKSLPAGKYQLSLTINDQAAKSELTKTVSFEVK